MAGRLLSSVLRLVLAAKSSKLVNIRAYKGNLGYNFE